MAATRRNFNLSAERAALIRSLKNAETNWYAMCRDFRDVGQCWLNIKAELQERGISARAVGIGERTHFKAMAG